jgi:hypothetical protein
MRRQVLRAGILIILPWILASGQALCDSNGEDTWRQRDGISLSVGMFVPNYNTKIRKSNDATDGSQISLEDDLGLDDDDEIPLVTFSARPWSKHKFFFSYMGMDRDASEVLSEDITFDGVTFSAGTDVDTDFDIDMYRAGYTWSFWQSAVWELGFSVGAYWVDMDMKLAALDGAVTADYNESERFPMIGFSGSWLLNEDWLIRGTAEAFSIDRNDTEGDFYNVRLEGEYAFSENLSIGVGYDLVSIDAKDTKKNNKINYDYDGALVFLRWHF